MNGEALLILLATEDYEGIKQAARKNGYRGTSIGSETESAMRCTVYLAQKLVTEGMLLMRDSYLGEVPHLTPVFSADFKNRYLSFITPYSQRESLNVLISWIDARETGFDIDRSGSASQLALKLFDAATKYGVDASGVHALNGILRAVHEQVGTDKQRIARTLAEVVSEITNTRIGF